MNELQTNNMPPDFDIYEAKEKVTKWLVCNLVIILSLTSISISLSYVYNIHIELPYIIIFGTLGGFTSMQTELNKMCLDDLYFLSRTKMRVLLSSLTGGMLAIILYFIFLGGLLSGDLFPKFAHETGSAGVGALVNCKPYTTQDFAKLFVWAFLAGYSENLVTNILRKFSPKLNNHD